MRDARAGLELRTSAEGALGPRSARLARAAALLLIAATVVVAFALAPWGGSPAVAPSKTAPAGDQGSVGERYGKLPLAFEANHGQADGRVDFLARAAGQTAYLTPTGATLALRPKLPQALWSGSQNELTASYCFRRRSKPRIRSFSNRILPALVPNWWSN